MDGKANKAQQFSQTADGHAAVVRQLQKLSPELVVFEATGIYYFDHISTKYPTLGVTKLMEPSR